MKFISTTFNLVLIMGLHSLSGVEYSVDEPQRRIQYKIQTEDI